MGKLRWKAESRNICSGGRHARFSRYTKNEQGFAARYAAVIQALYMILLIADNIIFHFQQDNIQSVDFSGWKFTNLIIF